MKLDLDIEKCPNCKSINLKVEGNIKEVFGLVSLQDNDGKVTANFNKVIPVVPVICQDCGHIELFKPSEKSLKEE